MKNKLCESLANGPKSKERLSLRRNWSTKDVQFEFSNNVSYDLAMLEFYIR
jgi:hypothetical protein